jgi:glutathione S-transferase
MDELRVFTFAPNWGLPTMGPFALKLLAWLQAAGLAYTKVTENRADKGPLGKSPWIEEGALRMGDSDAIIRHLAARHGLPDPTAVGATVAAAHADALKLAFEERFHQILEWELFVHPAGKAEMRRVITADLPPVIGPLAFAHFAGHLRRQLHARGIARLPEADIQAAGRRQLDGLVLCLEAGRGWLGEDGLGLADFAVWGQVAPMLAWPMATPVAAHAKSLAPLGDWHDRIMRRYFATPPATAAASRPEPLRRTA